MARELPVKVKIAAVDRLSKVIDRVKAKFPELTRGVRRTNTAFEILERTTAKYSKAAEKIGKSIQKAGNVMTAGITLPVLAAGGYGLKAFADYETALQGVGKTTDLSGAALTQFGAKFRTMSKTIPIAVEELLQLGQTAAQLGVKGEPQILKFSETLGKLARATNIQGEEGAADLARFLTISNTPMESVDRMGSALVALGNTSAATEAEILGFSTRLAGATALFGFSGTQVLGYATAMKSVGIEAEAGSSAIQRALGEMNEAISKGGQKAQVLSKLTGIAMADLKTSFKKDAAGTLQKFAEGLSKLEAKGGDVTQALAFFGLSGVRDIAVMGALTKNTGLLTEKMKTAGDAFKENTALNKEFASATSTLASKFQLTKNRVNDLAITIGERLAPYAIRALESFDAFLGFLERHPGVAEFLSVMAMILAVVGPILIAIGWFTSTVIPGLITAFNVVTAVAAGFGSVLSFLGTVLSAIGAILAGVTLPVWAIIAAIVAAVAAIWIWRDAIWKGIVWAWEKVLDILGAVVDKTAGAMKALGRLFGMGNTEVNVNASGAPAGGLTPQGAAIGGADVAAKANQEFFTRTNNAHVRVDVRAPQSTMVRGESQGGVLTINRGLVGAF